MEVKQMIHSIFTRLVSSRRECIKKSSWRTKKEVDTRKIRRKCREKKTIEMPSWKCDYDMNEKTWYHRRRRSHRRRCHIMWNETYVISKQCSSSFAHTINTFTYTCGSKEKRTNERTRERGKSLWTKTLNRFLGDLPMLYAILMLHSFNSTIHPLIFCSYSLAAV